MASPLLSDFAPTVWAVGVQFLLYAAGWAACSLLLREHRRAVLHWSVFMALVGIGLVLASARDAQRGWLPFVGADIAFVGAYASLRVGLEHFMALPRRRGEHALTLGLYGAAALALGPGVESAPWRVSLTYGVGAFVMVRTVWVAWPAGRAEFGARLMALLAVPAVLLGTMLALRAGEQLADLSHPLEMHLANTGNRSLLLSYLVGAALFSFSFMALLVARLVGRLRQLSLEDPLTGLLNRRALETALQREWERTLRGHGAFAVLALDLDHFKRVNDVHGHAGGDRVLREVAQRVRVTLRKTDIAARTGGEEFVVIVPGADEAAARAMAERLRENIARQPIAMAAGAVRVTTSVGVALAGVADRHPERPLERADAALYAAKRAGRDRVHVAGEAVPA
jgi:diguanylate cyclase (GGDEF)-like protein